MQEVFVPITNLFHIMILFVKNPPRIKCPRLVHRMKAEQAALRERSTAAVAEELVDNVVVQQCLEVAAFEYRLVYYADVSPDEKGLKVDTIAFPRLTVHLSGPFTAKCKPH